MVKVRAAPRAVEETPLHLAFTLDDKLLFLMPLRQRY
jgi:hypothetical protein